MNARNPLPECIIQKRSFSGFTETSQVLLTTMYCGIDGHYECFCTDGTVILADKLVYQILMVASQQLNLAK